MITSVIKNLTKISKINENLGVKMRAVNLENTNSGGIFIIMIEMG